MLEITLLGTGAAERVPSPACYCPTCVEARLEPALRRKHAKALVSWGGRSVLIDCGSDIEDQVLQTVSGRLDGVLLTHFHFDHVLGLPRLSRRRNGAGPLALLHPRSPAARTAGRLMRFFNGHSQLEPIAAESFQQVRLGEFLIEPLPLSHTVPTFGYLLWGAWGTEESAIAYLTDTGGLPASTIRRLLEVGPKVVVLDATFATGSGERGRHNDVAMALELLDQLDPRLGVLTHIGHHNAPFAALVREVSSVAPRWIVAVDGMSVRLGTGSIAVRTPGRPLGQGTAHRLGFSGTYHKLQTSQSPSQHGSPAYSEGAGD